MTRLGLVSAFSLGLGGATVARAQQNEVPSAASQATESAKSAAQQATQGAQGAAQNTKDAVQSGANATKNAAQSTTTTTKQAAQNAGSATKETAQSAGQKAKDTANSTAKMTNDNAIDTKVETKIAAHVPQARNIHVETKEGVVTLRGNVESEAQRKRVVGLAEQTSGVNRVDDELEVTGSK